MITVFYPSETPVPNGRYVATIGFFDGVHRGHCHVVERLKSMAREQHKQSMLITFEHHPRQVVCPDWQPQLLTSLEEKQALLSAMDIDVLVVLRFTKSMAALSARQFMEQVLLRDLHADVLLTGYDNRFGHDRTEGFEDYVRYGRELGISVLCADAVDVTTTGSDGAGNSVRVSSSVVRHMLQEGRVDEAAVCLGRCYSLMGTVVHGEQIGSSLGFPTANMEVTEENRLIPASGVYAVRVDVDSKGYIGVMNIGCRPTFGIHNQTLEVNILDFSGDIYGHHIKVSFVSRLREEKHFSSREALVNQMTIDVEIARAILNK